MSGHSKWSTIKHRKGAQDSKRAKIFTKVIKEITVAVKLGGDSPESNTRLRAAMAWAKSVNMPSSNVQNAVKKGLGPADGQHFETVIYEGYGPANVAVVVECLTDNRNRTASSVRKCFGKNNANLGSANSVRYQFKNLGFFKIPKNHADEESFFETMLESPVEEIKTEADPDFYLVYAQANDFGEMQGFLDQNKIPVDGAELVLEAENVEVIDDPAGAEKVIRFIEMLEDDDDVQKVYSNFEISEGVREALENR